MTTLKSLLDAFGREDLLASPEQCTLAGRPEGIDRWDDLSESAAASERDRLKEQERRLATVVGAGSPDRGGATRC